MLLRQKRILGSMEHEERELQVSDEVLDISYFECYCDFCVFDSKWLRHLIRNLYLGFIFPPLWMINMVILTYVNVCLWQSGIILKLLPLATRYNEGDDSIRECMKRLFEYNIISQAKSSHDRTGRKLRKILWYTIGCVCSYAILVSLLIYGVLYPPISFGRPLPRPNL